MPSETIVITRPKGDEAAFSETLHARGYRVIHEPMTEIVLRHNERQNLTHLLEQDPDAIVITSRHGAHSLALLTELRDFPVLCVGEATADSARGLGFTRVSAAGGSSASLMTYIQDAYDSGSRFVYVSAAHIRSELPELLAAYGMAVARVIGYEALAVPQLSDTLAELLKRRQVDGVTFLSQRAGQIFESLCRKAGVAGELRHLAAYTLSDAIADRLDREIWGQIHAAGEPTLASLAACVDNAA